MKSELIQKAIEVYDANNISKYVDISGNQFSESFINSIKWQLNLPLQRSRTVLKYGIAIERCNLRAFPTNEVALNEEQDISIDRFQETAVYPLEPITILHTSINGDWCFVQTYNYQGWIHKSSLVEMSRSEFIKCFQENQFCYVTKDFITVNVTNSQYGSKDIQLPMGSRIPRYVLCNKIDCTEFHCDLSQAGLYSEPLKFTRAKILELAMQCLDDPYDWGGKKGYRDCSSLVVDIFRCFGFTMTRNANQQAKTIPDCSQNENIHDYGLSLSKLKPGALIYITGHVMIYLGYFQNEHYVVHAVKEFYDLRDGYLEKSPLSGIQITPLSIYRKNGDSYISSIYAVCDFLPSG